MEILLALLLCAAAVVGGAFLAFRISDKTGFTLGFGPWFVCFILAFASLKWTPLLNAYLPYGEFIGALAIMFLYGIAHGFNVTHTARAKSGNNKPNNDKKDGDGGSGA